MARLKGCHPISFPFLPYPPIPPCRPSPVSWSLWPWPWLLYLWWGSRTSAGGGPAERHRKRVLETKEGRAKGGGACFVQRQVGGEVVCMLGMIPSDVDSRRIRHLIYSWTDMSCTVSCVSALEQEWCWQQTDQASDIHSNWQELYSKLCFCPWTRGRVLRGAFMAGTAAKKIGNTTQAGKKSIFIINEHEGQFCENEILKFQW